MQMHKRKKPSDNNFELTPPATQAMFANEVFRSCYNLDSLVLKTLYWKQNSESIARRQQIPNLVSVWDVITCGPVLHWWRLLISGIRT